MPSGRTHFVLANLTEVAILGFGVYAALQGDATTGVCMSIGGFVGIWITPDADLEGKTYTEKKIARIPVLGALWIIAWYAYAYVFQHRGISHIPALGTLTRMVYLFFIAWKYMIFLVGFMTVYMGGSGGLTDFIYGAWWMPPLDILWPIFLGWATQDLIHEIADALYRPTRPKGEKVTIIRDKSVPRLPRISRTFPFHVDM